MLESGTMFLDARLRRMTTYLYVQDLLAGAHVLEVGSESNGDFLRARQARSVGRRDRRRARGAAGRRVRRGLRARRRGRRAAVDGRGAAARGEDRTAPWCWPWRAAIGPARAAGASYYELVDLLEPMFPSVKMVGQAPFVGATLVEYGAKEPDPVLDGTMVPKGERVEWYVVVAGPKRTTSRGYGVMQVPVGDVGVLPAERRTTPQAEPARAAPPMPKPPAPSPSKPQAAAPPRPVAPPKPQPSDEELKALLAAAQKGKAELQDFILKLQREMSERDAYIAELDGERRELGRLREETRRAERARRQGGGRRTRDAQAAGRGRGHGRAAARGRDAAGRRRAVGAGRGGARGREREAQAEGSGRARRGVEGA